MLARDALSWTAAEAYRAALAECTRETAPFEWSRAYNRLGDTLAILGIEGGEGERLLEAVNAYRKALDGVNREHAPLDWAITQNNLGKALEALGESETGTWPSASGRGGLSSGIGRSGSTTLRPITGRPRTPTSATRSSRSPNAKTATPGWKRRPRPTVHRSRHGRRKAPPSTPPRPTSILLIRWELCGTRRETGKRWTRRFTKSRRRSASSKRMA